MDEDKLTAMLFQSTLPAWGATVICSYREGGEKNISIHAPRMGSDKRLEIDLANDYIFQSTLPAWGATRFP